MDDPENQQPRDGHRPRLAVLLSICPVIFAAGLPVVIAKRNLERSLDLLMLMLISAPIFTFVYAIFWRQAEGSRGCFVFGEALFFTVVICVGWAILAWTLLYAMCSAHVI
jgi:hypothetical protein